VLDLALTWLPTVFGVLALVTVPSVLLQRQGRPTAALSWLFALFAVPYLTVPAWWFAGRTHLGRRKARRKHAASRFTGALAGTRTRPAPALSGVFPVLELPAELLQAAFPPSAGNRARLLVDAAVAYDAWERAIAAARDHVHLLFYIWNDDETGRRLLAALRAAVARGVEVRVLYDDVGTSRGRRTFAGLVKAGGQARPFMPLRFRFIGPEINFRNHRKLLVVDGRQAFLGGINVGDEYLTWHDVAVQVEGPAVDQAQEVFCDDWYFTTDENLAAPRYFGCWEEAPEDPAEPTGDVDCAIVASGPTEAVNATRELVFMAITEARRRLWIMTPYLILDSALVLALRAARYRGADVRVIVPARSDIWLIRRASRSFYPDLVAAGIRVFEYPGMVHAKTMIVDEHLTMVGSANMDTRSFRLNFELTGFFASDRLNTALSKVCEADFAKSREVQLDEISDRASFTRMVDAAAHLLSPIL
jgi:cardiolipin synthase A/B